MSFRSFVKDYFTFTRKERIGLLTLVSIIVIVWVSPRVLSPASSKQGSKIDTSWFAEVKEMQLKPAETNEMNEESNPDNYSFQKSGNRYFNKGDLFYFDPNTLDLDGWFRLGLREKTVQTIQNYLLKGGRFYKPEDLEKIYGLKKEEYERLKPYIRIEQKTEKKPNESFTALAKEFSETGRNKIIDINSADTSAFIALPGIGSRLAARIVSFREKLGGFYSIEQIGETYGLPDSTFQKIRQYLKLENITLRKIDINSSTKEELRMHPYIKWNIANAIVEFRSQHGNFLSVDDLKKIALIDTAIFNRISRYLVVQ